MELLPQGRKLLPRPAAASSFAAQQPRVKNISINEDLKRNSERRWSKKTIFLFTSRRPKRPCPLVVPTMTAAFLDENLPDGTRLRPGTKFIKYWKMRNTGTMSWNAETKVKTDPFLS